MSEPTSGDTSAPSTPSARDWTRVRLCDTFWEFANICLHRGSRTLYDDPPDMVFRAAWYGRRVKKRHNA